MRRPINYDARTILAFGITVAAVIGISILAWASITNTDPNEARAQNVLNAVLPLFGAWVGTVLAYYFSRENFEAAANSTQQLVRQLTPEERLRSTRVVDVMIKNIYSKNDLSAKVNDVLNDLEQKGVKRLPILKTSGVLEALVFVEGIQTYLLSLSEADRLTKTLDHLLKENVTAKQPSAFVGEYALARCQGYDGKN